MSQGRPNAEFRRAIERGNLLHAKAMAKTVAANAGGKLGLDWRFDWRNA